MPILSSRHRGGRDQVFQDAQPNIGAYNIGDDKIITGIITKYSFDRYDMYPNPLTAGEALIIQLPSDIKSERISIRVMEMTGRTVFNGIYENESQITLETSMLKKGCYLVSIVGKQKQYSRKIVIL